MNAGRCINCLANSCLLFFLCCQTFLGHFSIAEVLWSLNIWPQSYLITINLVPRVLRFFGQWLVTRRDSGDFEFYYRWISAVKQWKPLRNSQSKNLNFFQVPRVSPGAHPLTKTPEDSEYEFDLIINTPECPPSPPPPPRPTLGKTLASNPQQRK